MNYFELYEIPVDFKIEQELLKKKFYELSRKYHPDFFANVPEAKQQEVLHISTQNTNAYNTLSNSDKRMKYILEMKGLLIEGEKNNLPSEFLMEMMDINEAIMEIKVDPNPFKLEEISLKINEMESALDKEIQPFIKNYDDAKISANDLIMIRDFYHKKRYILRLKESLPHQV